MSGHTEIVETDQSTRAHHNEDVAGIGCHFIHGSIKRHDKLAEPVEMFLKGALCHTWTDKREIFKVYKNVQRVKWARTENCWRTVA